MSASDSAPVTARNGGIHAMVPLRKVIRATRSFPQAANSEMDDGHFLLRNVVPALALLVFTAAGIFILSVGRPGQGGQLAIVAPPWYTSMQTAAIIANAGGDIVGVGRYHNVVVAYSGNPGFMSALYRAGAWLVLHPSGLRGCLGLPALPSDSA